MTRRAKLISVALIAAVATALSGCATGDSDTPNFTSGMGTPTPTGSATASGSPTPTSSSSTSTNSPKPPTYPTNAKDYATQMITAWASGGSRQNRPRLEQLAAQGTLLQLDPYNGIDGHWSYVSCDGTAGITYCLFRNYNGDECTVGVTNQYLGQPHAATSGLIEKTMYPTSAVDYASNFMAAWYNGNTPRLLALASQTVVDKIKNLGTMSSYTALSSGAAGSTYVKFEGLGADLGEGLTVRLDNATLSQSKKHAVTCVFAVDTSTC